MKKNARRMALAVGALAVGATFALFYNAWRDPISGGQSPDNFFARREKARIYASFDPAIERQFVRLTPENANGWFHTFAEPIQGFESYQAQNPTRPSAARRVLVLQPLGDWKTEEAELLEPLRLYCANFFQLPARVAPTFSLAPVNGSSRPILWRLLMVPADRAATFRGANSTTLEPFFAICSNSSFPLMPLRIWASRWRI